jgi:hypothetical protein
MSPGNITPVAVAALAVPVGAILSTLILGIRQLRSLRSLTDDHSVFTAILGVTRRDPGPPNPEHLKVHAPMKIYSRFYRERSKTRPQQNRGHGRRAH